MINCNSNDIIPFFPHNVVNVWGEHGLTKNENKFYFAAHHADKTLQPIEHFRHTSASEVATPAAAQERQGKRQQTDGEHCWNGRKGQRKPRVADLRWSVGDSLSLVLCWKGGFGGGSENVQKTSWPESTVGINLWSPRLQLCSAVLFDKRHSPPSNQPQTRDEMQQAMP